MEKEAIAEKERIERERFALDCVVVLDNTELIGDQTTTTLPMNRTSSQTPNSDGNRTPNTLKFDP